ncbi:MAG: GNAT family N-acetyltransferase [Trueperaceae bacterium]|nr:GNAT family N-acetyltransferase [Trueperaceae bacterium]
MRVQSLGLHTDLALHGWRGSVRDRIDHLVVTDVENPDFRWGNVLVFDAPPAADDFERWCDLFDASIGTPPWVPHRAFGWDGLDGDEGELAPFLAAGFERERGLVLAASRLAAPESANRDVRIRPLHGDADWAAARDGQRIAIEATGEEPAHERFITRLMAAYRRVVDAGHGVWWGAFDGDALVANLGVFKVGELARYQAVVTDPEYRRRGVASTLVHHAAEAARTVWGSELLLLETEPEGPALGLYERLGFAPIEQRVGVCQYPRPEVDPWRAPEADEADAAHGAHTEGPAEAPADATARSGDVTAR